MLKWFKPGWQRVVLATWAGASPPFPATARIQEVRDNA
jgi:hypothetical protein